MVLFFFFFFFSDRANLERSYGETLFPSPAAILSRDNVGTVRSYVRDRERTPAVRREPVKTRGDNSA